MNAVVRRLTRLEQQYRPVDPSDAIERAWLSTLCDADLEVLEEAVEHIEGGGDLATLPTDVQGRYRELIRAYAVFREEQS